MNFATKIESPLWGFIFYLYPISIHLSHLWCLVFVRIVYTIHLSYLQINGMNAIRHSPGAHKTIAVRKQILQEKNGTRRVPTTMNVQGAMNFAPTNI